MNRIIVAFENSKLLALVTSALEGAGLPARRSCHTRAEAIRAIGGMGGGIVVCGYKLIDGTAEELAYDLGPSALVLVVSRPEMLEMCENPDVFKLASPFSRGELLSAVRMLIQLEQMRLPRRDEDEKRIIAQAKKLLMGKRNLTEPEAHRVLQRASMASGEKMSLAAKRVIEKEQSQ